MAEMLIQSESLTSIADKIRVLKGITEPMSLDDMETELGTVDNAVTAALSALVEKGVEVPEGTNVTGLAELIAAIEAGGGKLVNGSFTPSTYVGTMTVTHGLGKVPNFILLAGKNICHDLNYGTTRQTWLMSFFYEGVAITAFTNYISGKYQGCTAYVTNADITLSRAYDKFICSANENSVTFDGSYASAKMISGAQYMWWMG